MKGKLSVRQQIMTEEEMQLNPQVNQNKRKAAKQNKKEVCAQVPPPYIFAVVVFSVSIEGAGRQEQTK